MKKLAVLIIQLILVQVLCSLSVQAAVMTPNSQGAKTFGTDPFNLEYQLGYINIQDHQGSQNQQGNPQKLPLILNLDGSNPNTWFYHITNTKRESDCYIDHYNAASYKGEKYDIREYVWVSHTGAGIASDIGWHTGGQKLATNNDNVLYRELHFYKAGTLKSNNQQEVQFKGIIQFADFDELEGVEVNNCKQAYLTNPTWNKLYSTQSGDIAGTYRVKYLGTASGTALKEQALWVEVESTPQKPLIITYIPHGTKGGSINFQGTTYTGEITYDSNNGQGEASKQIIQLGYDTTIAQNQFNYSEHKFVEWNTRADGKGTQYSPSQVTQFNQSIKLYAIWEIDLKPISLQLQTAVQATAASNHGGIALAWGQTDQKLITYKAFQAQANQYEYTQILNDPSKWTTVQQTDITQETEPIYVINLIPALSSGEFGTTRTGDITTDFRRKFTLPEYDWDGYPTGETYTINMVQFGALKAWMEGGSVDYIYTRPTNQGGGETVANETYEAYGKQPSTGQQIIRVIPVYMRDFNKDPSKYLWYDEYTKTWKTKVDMHSLYSDTGRVVEVSEIFIGSADGNGDSKDQPQTMSIQSIGEFLNTGGQVLAGHDTIVGWKFYNTQTLGTIRSRFKIWLFEQDVKEMPYTHFFGQTEIIVTKQGLMTNYPYEIKLGQILKVPFTHTVTNSSYGTVWMEFNLNSEGANKDFDWEDALKYNQGNMLYYLTTNNNTAMIQTGHSDCKSTSDERKIIANTLFYLKQTSTKTQAIDNSQQDFEAPSAVSKITQKIVYLDANNIEFTFQRPLDKGTYYTHVVQAFLKDNISDSFGLSNGNLATQNYVSKEVITGVQGYYSYVDTNSQGKISLVDGKVQQQTGKLFDSSYTNKSSLNELNRIYNKTISIEYITSQKQVYENILEGITANQNSQVDKTTTLRIDVQNIRKQIGQNKVYLHIAPYDAAGNIGDTTTVEIQLGFIEYNSNNGSGQQYTDDIQIGAYTTTRPKDTFVYNGYRFVEWNTKADGTGTQYKPSTAYKFNSPVVLYAIWEPVLSLSINPNGGEWTDSYGVQVRPGGEDSQISQNPTNKTYSTSITFKLGKADTKQIKDAVRTGYNFFGWAIDLIK